MYEPDRLIILDGDVDQIHTSLAAKMKGDYDEQVTPTGNSDSLVKTCEWPRTRCLKEAEDRPCYVTGPAQGKNNMVSNTISVVENREVEELDDYVAGVFKECDAEMAQNGSTFEEELAQLASLWKPTGMFLKHPDIDKVENTDFSTMSYIRKEQSVKKGIIYECAYVCTSRV